MTADRLAALLDVLREANNVIENNYAPDPTLVYDVKRWQKFQRAVNRGNDIEAAAGVTVAQPDGLDVERLEIAFRAAAAAMAYSVHVAPRLRDEWADSGWRLLIAEYGAAQPAPAAHTITPECGPICWTTGHHHDVEACDGCRRLMDTGTRFGKSLAQPAPDLLQAARMALRWHDETSALGMAEPLAIAALRAAVEGATA